jgi:hypothetical protein
VYSFISMLIRLNLVFFSFFVCLKFWYCFRFCVNICSLMCLLFFSLVRRRIYESAVFVLSRMIGGEISKVVRLKI